MPDFEGPPLARPERPSPPERPVPVLDVKGLSKAPERGRQFVVQARTRSQAQEYALKRLQEQPHAWVALDKIVGMALVRRGLAECRDRPRGSRGQKDFRMSISPGPYRIEGPRPLTLVEQEQIADGETGPPRWSVVGPDGQDSEWFEEEDARAEAGRLNQKASVPQEAGHP